MPLKCGQAESYGAVGLSVFMAVLKKTYFCWRKINERLVLLLLLPLCCRFCFRCCSLFEGCRCWWYCCEVYCCCCNFSSQRFKFPMVLAHHYANCKMDFSKLSRYWNVVIRVYSFSLHLNTPWIDILRLINSAESYIKYLCYFKLILHSLLSLSDLAHKEIHTKYMHYICGQVSIFFGQPILSCCSRLCCRLC